MKMVKPRLRVIPQLDSQDCGPACLLTILGYYGRNYAREYIETLCRMDRLGSSLGAIARAAEHLGFKTLAVKTSFDEMRAKVQLPCIAYLTAGHYVVVCSVKARAVRVIDPSLGRVKFTRQEFERGWLADSGPEVGVLLLLEPTSEPIPQASNQSTQATHLRQFLKPFWQDVRRHLFLLGSTAVVSLAVQFTLPFLSAALVDLCVNRRDLGILPVICIAQIIFLFGRLTSQMIQGWALAFIGIRCDLSLVSRFLFKLTRLPLAFFDGKTAGDLMQRINDQKAIEHFLSSSVSQLSMAVLSVAMFGTVLALYRPLLFAVFLVGAMLYAFYSIAYFRRQRSLNYKMFRLSARKQGVILELLAGMQELKLNNAERQRRWAWEKTQHSLASIQLRSRVLGLLQSVGGTLINELSNIILVVITTLSVVKGKMSLGSMVAVQYVIGQLSIPVQQLVGLMVETQDASLSYVRAQQIECMSDEESKTQGLPVQPGSDITLAKVSFGYGGTNPRLVLRDVNLHIPFGRTTAIVGRTGSGKTTLLKLLLKYYAVTRGAICVGTDNILDLSHAQWRSQCGIVMQDGYLFSDTIVRNIAVGDDFIDMARVEEVAQIAQILDFITTLPLGYATKIGRDGIGISRGQAQRIQIARALYKDPQYLFFDEATSALDAETERALVEQLAPILRARTSLIIAHRMSTVRHADQIVVLDDGMIAEIGAHEELVEKRGEYFNIVKNQLELR